MIGYALRRLVSAIPIVAVVVTVIFLLLYLAPGDPAPLLAGEYAGEAEIEAVRERLGLNEPFLTRFGTWLGALARGDLGVSIFTSVPVTTMIAERAEATIALTLTTTILSMLVGIPFGAAAAWRAGGRIDRAVMAFAAVGYSVPTFVVGYLLMLVFSANLRLLPVQGYLSISEDFGGFLARIILPSFAMSLPFIAILARITRASVVEVLSQDFVRTAFAKGLSDRRVMTPHVIKNAAVPISTMVGLGMAHLISGVVVIETVFSIPGIGRLVVEAVLRRDYPVIQGVTLMFSVAYILLNLLIDLSYALFDPRIRY